MQKINKFYLYFLLVVISISIAVQKGNSQIIFRQNFDTAWTTPATLYPSWSGTTTPPDNQWQRNDYTTGWTTASGAYTPTGASSTTNSVRFHTFNALTGSAGDLITPAMDFSLFTGTKKLDFYHINTTGGDSLRVYFSTDNGATWSASLITLGVSASWTRYSVVLGASTSTTCRVKFSATSDAGTTDIGIDQVLIYNGGAALSGTKLIDPLIGDYKSFTEAINILNLSGVGTGGVTFNVTSGTTYTEDPPAITATGTLINPIIFQKSGLLANPIIKATGTAALNDAAIGIAGGSYITFDGIDINIATGQALEYGYYIYNASPTVGAQFNTIKNSNISLGYMNGLSLGIYQNVLFVPTSASGTNSNNKYYNISIQYVHSGIYLLGNATYPDNLCEIGVTDSTKTSYIGGASAQNIYGYAGPTFGIKAAQQSNCKIFNCEVRNVWSYDYTLPTDGILFDNDGTLNTTSVGTGNKIYNSKVHDISNSASQVSNVSKVSGIRVNLSNNAANLIQVYNNFIWNISNSATQYYNPTERSAYAIYLQNSGGAGEIDLYSNNTRLTGNASSNTCLEIGTVTGPILIIKNNIFANFSSNMANKFYSIVVPSQTLIGNTGSISNYNDLFNGGNATYGYIGKADTSNLKTLAAWQTKVTQDANSKNVDPTYITATDLHVSYVNRNLYRVGTPIATIYNDIDYQARNNPPCIGADEYTINDTTSKAEVPTTQVPSANIQSYDTTLALSIPVFSFKISDFGPDLKSTVVTNIKIKNNFPANNSAWSTTIAGVKLNDGTADIVTGTVVIADSSITIPIPSNNLIVANASSKTITLYVYLKKVLTGNKTLQFTIPNLGHGFVADGNLGSTFLTDFGAPITSNIHTIKCTATQLVITVPASTYINTNFSSTVTAKDGAGNVDPDFVGPVTLTRVMGTGALSSVTGLTQSLVLGTYTWADLRYNVTENFNIQAAGGALTILSSTIGCFPSSLGSVVLVGAGQVITSLTGVNGLFQIINQFGMQNSVLVKVTSNLTEDGTNALNQWQDTLGFHYTLTITPNDTAEKIIQGNVAQGMIRFNGADRVKFDGRFNNDGLKHLRIRNNNTTNPTFYYLNSAVHDTITYCNVESSNTNSSSGCFYFAGTTTAVGNDSNVVSYCDIRDRSDTARTMATAIMSNGTFMGTVAQMNSVNVFDHNNIYNFGAYGLWCMLGNADWVITNNSFYQTTAKAISSLYCIYINSPSAGTYTITGNYIGGTAPLCGGTPMTLSAAAFASFYPLMGSFQTATTSVVKNNTVQNIAFTITNSLNWYNFYVSSGTYIDSGNTIGSRIGTGSLTVANNSTGTLTFIGHYLGTAGTATLQNNIVGSLLINGTGTGAANIYGLYLTGTPGTNYSVTNNIIGSDTTLNSIQQTSARVCTFNGIYSTVTTKPVYILNNIIANVANYSTALYNTSPMIGINIGGSGIPYISNNLIKEIDNKAGDTLTALGSNALTGIYINSTGLNDTISLNTIQGLRANDLTTKTCVYGIAVNGTGSTGIFMRNKIFDLTDSSSHISARLYGVNNYLGTNWKYINNQISLSLGSDVQGIHDEFATGTFSTYYYNSIYIGGTVATGAINSYGFKRIKGATVSLLDNLFYNGRTGGTGFHFAVGNVKDTLAVGWNSTASNYNLYVAPDTNNIFERGAGIGQTFTAWKTATGGDKYSYGDMAAGVLPNNLFVNTALGNLNIIGTNVESWYVYGKGIQIPAVANDYSGNARSTTVAGGPPCIGSNECTINATTNAPSPVVVTPAVSTTSNFILDGRTFMNIAWGASLIATKNNNSINSLNAINTQKNNSRRNGNSNNDFPTTVTAYYYSGCIPDTTGVAQYGKSYWKIMTTSDPASGVGLTINYGDQELGNITSPNANMMLARYDVISHGWVSYPRGTSGNNVSIVDTINKTITVNGITALNNSIWAILSASSPMLSLTVDLKLLLEGEYFNGGKPGYMVKDTVKVILKDSTAGWATIDSMSVVLDSLGHGVFVSGKASLSGKYYLRIRHRNSMETWSALGNNVFSPGSGVLSYDFTTAQNKAYGNNQVTKNAKWCLYSGDINQDGFVDGSDMMLVDNAAYLGNLGWNSTDLNGDLFVDGSDLALCDNNAFAGILVSRPINFPGGMPNPLHIAKNSYRQTILGNSGNNDNVNIKNSKIKTDDITSNEFTLRVTNLTQVSPDSITFKVYLKNTSTTATQFASGQYYFNFNALALNNGTGTLSILSSDLNTTNQAPRNPRVVTSPSGQLWFNTNSVPGAGLGKLINPGDSIMVLYASLKTSAASFSLTNLGMLWRTSSSGIPYTKIFAYINNINTEITTSGVFVNPPDAPLPVELSSFSACVDKNSVKLNWSTSREINNAGFEVQKSAVNNNNTKTDVQWNKAGYLESKGNSISGNHYTFVENKLASGKYNYRLKQIDINGNVTYFNLQGDVIVGVPAKFELSQNYPNPFNPMTKIDYDLAKDSKVTISVYDISGRVVATLVNDKKPAGYYTLEFNASNLSSGVYFYQIIADNGTDKFVKNKKMMLIK